MASISSLTSPNLDQARIEGKGPSEALAQKLTSEAHEMLLEVSEKNPREALEEGKRLYEAATSKAAEDFLAKDIADATATVAKTQENFRIILAKLETIDRVHEQKFAPDWDKLRQEYDNTLGESRDLASSITAWCERLYGPIMLIIKNRAIRLESKKKTVERAMKATKDFENRSKEIANRFRTLAGGLVSFQEAITQFMSGLKSPEPKEEEKLLKDLKRLLAAIEDVKVSIEKISKNVDKSSSKKTPELDAAVNSGILPRIGSYLKGVFSHGSDKFNAEDLGREYTKLDELEKEKEAVLLKLPSENLKDLTTRIKDCKNSCLLFETIWNGTKGHCREIMTYLEDGQEEDDETSFEIFITGPTGPGSHYLVLARGLRKYTQGVVV